VSAKRESNGDQGNTDGRKTDLLPFCSSGEQRNSGLRNPSTFRNHGGMIDEYVGSAFENEERTEQRGSVVGDDFAVDHGAASRFRNLVLVDVE